MPVRETEAIILRTYPLGEGDRLVSFLSRSEGKLRGVAAGARKPRSRFGSALEPLSHVRIVFYERETRPLARISQAEIIESFWGAQRSYGASMALSLIAEISESVLPEREPSDTMFRLVLAACRAIERTGQVALPVAYFALWTVRLGGWLPELDRCAGCGRDLSALAAWALEDGSGVFCAQCRPPGTRALGIEARAAARPMLRESLEKLETGGAGVPPRELTEFLLDLVERHSEKKLQARPMLELEP